MSEGKLNYSPMGWITHAPLKHPTTEIPAQIVNEHYAGLAVYVYVPKEICSTSIQIHPQPRSFPGMSFIAYIEVKIPKPSSVESAISIIILNYNARCPTYPLPTSASLYSIFTLVQTSTKKVMEDLKPSFQLLTKTNTVYLVPKRDTQVIRPKINYVIRGNSLQHRVYYVFRAPVGMPAPPAAHSMSTVLNGSTNSISNASAVFPEAAPSLYRTGGSFSSATGGSSYKPSTAETLSASFRSDNISSANDDDDASVAAIPLYDTGQFIDSEGKKMCVTIRGSPDMFVGMLMRLACEMMDVPAQKHTMRLFTHPDHDIDLFSTLHQINRRRFILAPKEGKPDMLYFLALLSSLHAPPVDSFGPSTSSASAVGGSAGAGVGVGVGMGVGGGATSGAEGLSVAHQVAMQRLQETYEDDADELFLDEELDDIALIDNSTVEGSSAIFPEGRGWKDRDKEKEKRKKRGREKEKGEGKGGEDDEKDNTGGGGYGEEKEGGVSVASSQSNSTWDDGLGIGGGLFGGGMGMMSDSVDIIEDDGEDEWLTWAADEVCDDDEDEEEQDEDDAEEEIQDEPEAPQGGAALADAGGREKMAQQETGGETSDDEYEYVTDDDDYDSDEYEEVDDYIQDAMPRK
ncbi:uncharacterized protein MONOS_9834 [Monocercomonoides exilis]|uniref:uncharacterized protein n=1 Tax=Monocercomonoides exilis TaxID=2049356 RepID=UPI003559F3FD|nr:hypothetical protein MONOS_9834 [Monocercomonoides exilis]|eukprot:MONOS_9834.1-p1 / transcript=MONOS_9834.1 / gene=MONOS_9834 / organism=Monocercomonoides_exilis_PA203 / gene_product=unspecified product / transcript_product=unspecified product / location=Mono_scaffold00421:3090-5367(+) / protein_length=629 / sequence_SO=supercontig / SO=protein_coding / is_pseudo=false